MQKTTAGIGLRIITFILIGLYTFSLYKLDVLSTLLMERKIDFNTYVLKTRFYDLFKLALTSIFFLNVIFMFFFTKKDAEGRISVKDETFPEFTYIDEREALLTGRAAKIGLSILIYYSFVILLLFGLFIQNIPVLIALAVSIPIVGLLGYFISYKLLISK